MSKSNKDSSSIVIFISLIVIIAIGFFIVFLFKSLKNLIANHPWITIIIIFFVIIFSIITIIMLVNKYLKYKKNYFDLKENKKTEYSFQLMELKERIKNYEKIYPNLKNYEHPYEYNNDTNNNLGINGELTVKAILKNICNEKDLQLFNNLYLQSFEQRVIQIDHLLISDNCIFVIETKNWLINTYGDYFKKNWMQYHGKKQEFIPSPIHQNKSHIKTIHYIFKKENIDITQFKIFNIVVFVKNNLKINENNEIKTNEKVLNLNDLSLYITDKINKYSEKSLFNNYKNKIIQIILKNNKHENIKIHKKQLNY